MVVVKFLEISDPSAKDLEEQIIKAMNMIAGFLTNGGTPDLLGKEHQVIEHIENIGLVAGEDEAGEDEAEEDENMSPFQAMLASFNKLNPK